MTKAKNSKPEKAKEKAVASPADIEKPTVPVEGQAPTEAAGTQAPPVEPETAPVAGDDADSAVKPNMHALAVKLSGENIVVSYERCTDKQGVDHWNFTASKGDDDHTRTHTGRIEEHATEHEIKQVYEEILAAFSSD